MAPGTLEFDGTDRFEVEQRLGAGGFGVVYRVRDRQRQGRVALKTLDRVNPDTLYRFKKEFRSLADMRHQNVVALYELVAEQGKWFFTMELVEGVDFLTHVRGGSPGLDAEPTAPAAAVGSAATNERAAPADEARLRAALRQLAEGVSALHDAGWLHRDIKPSNVLVTREGRVVLLDFGLVTEADRQRTSEANVVMGTATYMPPEQARGEQVTEAGDWYAVGVMLYEALTGKPPFSGPVMQVLMAKQTVDPPPPWEIEPSSPRDLGELAMRLLCREPKERAGAGAVLEATHQAATPMTAAPSPVAAREPSGELFVGRVDELASLREAFAASHGAKPVVVQVRGRSGMGKSALLRRFLDELSTREPEVVILSGRCYLRESVPYKALDSLIDALCHHLRGLDRVQAGDLMPRNVRALARLFPVLDRVEAVAEAPAPGAEVTDQHELRRRAFNALGELLTGIAERRPLVLCIDDLQWGDLDSAVLLSDIVRRTEPPRMLLVLSFRSEEQEHSPILRSLLEQEPLPVTTREVEVGVLHREEASELAHALLKGRGESALVESVAAESGGSPLFINTLAGYLQAMDRTTGKRGQISLEQVLHDQVHELPDEAQRLLEVIAVAGQPLAIHTAKRAAGVEAGDPTHLERLLGARLVRRSGTEERVEPYHDRIRETVLGQLTADTLRQRHGQLAEALAAGGEADDEQLALHYRAWGADDKAATLAARAAVAAAEKLAFQRAARLFRMALELGRHEAGEARQLHAGLASALANTGRYDEAVRHFDAGLRHVQGAPPQGKLGIAFAVLWCLVVLFFRLFVPIRRRRPTDEQGALLDLRYEKTLSLIYIDPQRMFLESLALQKDLACHPVRSTPRGLEIWSFVSGVLAFSGLSFALSRRILARCNIVLDSTRAEEVLSCRLSDLVIKFSVGHWAAIPPLDSDLLQRNLDSGRFWHVSTYILYNALLHIGRGEFDEAERLIDQLDGIAEEHKFRHVAGAYAFFLRVNLLLQARRLADAETIIRSGLTYHREIGMEGPQILFHSALVLTELVKGDTGDPVTAREAMAGADRLVSQQAPAPPHYVAVYWIARIRLAQRLLEQAIEAGDARSVRNWRRVCARDLGASMRNARRYAFGRVETLMLHGRQCWVEGRRRRAVRSWEATIAEAQRLGSRLDEARARFLLGSSLLEVGDRSSRARNGLAPEEQVELAHRLFEDLGASWDLEQLRAWATARGGSAPSTP